MPELVSSGMSLEQAREVLHRFWGYDEFRPGQETAIELILSGRDTLTIMPTGGGKSLCYQVPAMLLPGVTVVVSPLISLMKDQVDTLDRVGLPATFVNSSLGSGEINARLRAAEQGAIKLLYVAPERFDSESFQQRLGRVRVSLLAVDEAHCVSEWGHDFRPSYLRLAHARAMLADPPVAALTATATPDVRRDIVRQLELRDPPVTVTGFDRRNLVWHAVRAKNDSEKDRLLLKLLRGREGSGIVYAATRKNVDALTAVLNGVGIRTVGYHAGLPDAERKRVQDAFMSGEAPVVVATNAFGMGIDKRDVRIVVHYNMPSSLEAYYQEAGRAGRDGGPAECVLLHAYADRFTPEFFIEQAHPPRKVVEATMTALRKAADQSGVCSLEPLELAQRVAGAKGDRQVGSALRLLEEHGLVRQVAAGGPSGVRVRLIALPARITRELAGAGRDAEVQLLRGLWRFGGKEGVYRGIDLEWKELWRLAGGRTEASELLESLAAESFLEYQSTGGEDGIHVLDLATPVSRLPVDWPSIERRRERELRKLQQMQRYAYCENCRRGYVLRYLGDPAAMAECGACDNCLASPAAAESASQPADPALETRLRALRADLAKQNGIPAHFVFTDAVMRAIASARPATPEELLAVPGIGPKLLAKWGGAILQALGAEPSPAPSTPPREIVPDPSAGESELYARLKALRSELAREAGLPAYCVFPDRTLIALARTRPGSPGEMLGIEGVGPARLAKYGERFLSEIRLVAE